jgi:hypothetical protein
VDRSFNSVGFCLSTGRHGILPFWQARSKPRLSGIVGVSWITRTQYTGPGTQ